MYQMPTMLTDSYKSEHIITQSHVIFTKHVIPKIIRFSKIKFIYTIETYLERQF